jgi:hypothetical protein
MSLPASDNFNRADTYPTPDLGANWTNQANGPAIFSNQAIGTGSGATNGLAFWNADSFAADHYSQATVVTQDFMGPSVRASGTGGASNAYFAFIYPTFGWRIYKMVAGTVTLLLDKADGSAGTFANGDVMKFSAVGTTLTVYKNGTSLGSTTDASLSSGSAGLMTSGSSARFDDWSADNIGGGGGGVHPWWVYTPPAIIGNMG